MRPKARVLALVLLVSLANAQQEPALKQDPKQALPAAGDETGVAAAAVREVATVQEVEASVKQAAELRSTVQRVINRLIAKDAPGDLANQGLGDISPTGACKEEIARHCKKKKPGARRLAKCLWDHLEEQDDKDDEEEESFSHECRAELDALEQDAAGNVNKNIPLALACKEDIEERCQDVDVGQPGALLACLRRKRRELRAPCKKQVFIAMLMSAQDLRLDLQAWKECSADAKRLCPTVAAHRGRIQWCLRNNTGSLSWECKAQLFRRDLERSADVRLSVRLLKKCMADKQKFCADIEPGESRVKDCLEEHMLEDDLSKECGEELAAMVQARSTNFRMDSKIREYCAQDVERLCGIPQATMVSENLTQHEDSIQRCLQDYRRELRSPACSARVSRMVALSMADIRFNHPLADACAADRASLCGSVPPGSARVIRCLKAKRDELAEGCAAMLFDQEQVMAENIDFQFPLKRACTAEIFKYCGAVPHGRGRVARCLQLNLEQGQAFSRGCRQELQASEARAAQDYRLNARLRDACQKTIAALCGQACGSLTKKAACGGTVLQCLTEQYDSIDEQDCKAEVFYFMKMEVRDFRNDVFLAEACRSDVDRYCQEHIETGHGRVVQCLHDNRDRLTAGCRAEEIKLDVMQSSNIELRPSLARACAEERQQHCADVRPGKARVLDCLLAQADKVDFSEQCRKVLGSQQAQRLQDWRRDFGMRTACSNDVGEVCGDAAEQADSQDGSVFRCLLAGGDGVSRGCQRAMSHAASAALQFYQLSMPGLEACDQDVLRHCSINGQVPQAVGQVKGCLGARLAYDRAVLANRTVPAQILPAILPPRPVEVGAASEPGNPGGGRRLSEASPGSKAVRRRQRAPILSQACRDVLDVASPEDSLASLESGLSTNAVLSSLAGVEKALGLEEGALQNKHQEGTKVLTLTGWVAVVALFGLGVATVGGGLYAVRRFTDPARNGYTRVIKHIPLADR